MRRKAGVSKRDAILEAMLEVVVERGFHEAPMSLIAERAGASAGVIYHYFASKEAIIDALYNRIREEKQASFLAGYSAEMDAKEGFILVWTNLYRFYRKKAREMRFLERYEAAGFPCDQEQTPTPRELEFRMRFMSRAKGGVLKDWPAPVLNELTIGVVSRLAKHPKTLSWELIQDVAARMWDAVRAQE